MSARYVVLLPDGLPWGPRASAEPAATESREDAACVAGALGGTVVELGEGLASRLAALIRESAAVVTERGRRS